MKPCKLIFQYFLFTALLFTIFPSPSHAQEGSVLKSFGQEFVQLVKNVEKSAVSIEAHMGIGEQNGNTPAIEMINSGAGLIIDANHIVSKQKIVLGSQEIHVKFYDGSNVTGKIVGSDDNLGLSVIQVEKQISSDFFPRILEDPANVSAGEPVLILSNSLGVMPAVSFGMVNCRRGDGMIQLSADLPAGASGGAVFNFSGELIGLVAVEIDFFPDELPFSSDLIASETVLVSPMRDIKRSMTSLIAQAGKNKIYFGVLVEDWPSQLGGAHVKQVYQNSPAATAGIKTGDIVLSTENHKVAKAYDLFKIISSLDVGDNVSIQILRGDQIVPVTVTLSSPPTSGPRQISTESSMQASSVQNDSQKKIGNDYLNKRLKMLENELKILREMIENN
jgi:S1-C subfamily serine protease